MFYIATDNGFVSNQINYFVNISNARAFTTFNQAEAYAKEACFKKYCILNNKF